MKWEPLEAKAGDMVRIRLGSLYHYGIFVSEDEVIQFGLPPTAENRAKEGEVKVLATDIDTFACGCIVETAVLEKAERRRRLSGAETIRRAKERIGEGGYNLIHNNCEHFVNACVFGEAQCSQADDVRRRWLSRPICDVYLARIPAVVSDNGIVPEKRRRELTEIADPASRSEALFAWKLLLHAAKRSFGVTAEQADFKRKLGGKWVSGRFRFSVACRDGLAAVAVSNAAVSLRLNGKADTGVSRTLKHPRLTVTAEGAHANAAKYFWFENDASALMGGKLFE